MTNPQCKIMNHSELSIGIQTWIWVLKAASENACTCERESKRAHRKKDVHKFYSSTDNFRMFKSGASNMFCARAGTVIVGWLAGHTYKQHSRCCT